ncbi:hypothetical protein E4T42_01099 [Aureobasidium subglaciale]|nr:hypothetical protein E4T42_01099 [Aureobasidium subglaciale]
MPHLSQTRPSNLCQMTRAISSDGPPSDDLDEAPYHENVRTTSVPTKSGTEVVIRPQPQSDGPTSTSGPSSRPSSKASEIDLDDAELIKALSAEPSTIHFDCPARTIQKPSAESVPELEFIFRPYKSDVNVSSKPRSAQTSRSSLPASSASFEKSNQEHEVSIRSAHRDPADVPTPQGLSRLFPWLALWLTLNLEAPIEFQMDSQPPGSRLFQNASVQVQNASPSPSTSTKSARRSRSSSMQTSKQLQRKQPVTNRVSPSRPHKTIQTPDEQTTEQMTNSTDSGLTKRKPISADGVAQESKDTNGPRETTGDLEVIFSLEEKPTINLGKVSVPRSIQHVESQRRALGEEAQARSKLLQVESEDVLMEERGDFEHLSDGDNTIPIRETHQLIVESEPCGSSHTTSGDQRSAQDLCVVADQSPVREQESVQMQHSVEAQLADDVHHVNGDHLFTEKHPSAELERTIPPELQVETVGQIPPQTEDRGPQRPKPLPDTTSTRAHGQQLLPGVSGCSGPSGVAKKKAKSSTSESAVRGPMLRSKSIHGSPQYTAAQLYQLADYMKEQERMQEKQEWLRALAMKQAELEKANKQKSSLEVECVGLKDSLKRYSGMSEKLKQIIVAYNGLGRDMTALQHTRASYDRGFRSLKNQLDTNLNAATKATEQSIVKLDKVKTDILSLVKECKVSLITLAREKSDLKKRLSETSTMLAQERECQAAFDQRLQSLNAEKKTTGEMLNGCTSKIDDRLHGFKSLIEQSNSSSATSSNELLELMKKETAAMSDQVRSSVANIEMMKTSTEKLSAGFEKHIQDFKAANTQTSETHIEVDNKVMAALELIKSDFKTWEALAEKNAALHESVSTEKQQSQSSKEMVEKLKVDLDQKSSDERSLRTRLKELQSSQVDLQFAKTSAEADKVKLLELARSEGNLKQELEKSKSQNAENMATIAAMDEQKKNLQRGKSDLQSQFREAVKDLEQARRVVPDFGPEEARIKAAAKKQSDETIAEVHTQVRKLNVDFNNKMLRQEKKKEEVDRELAAREKTVKDLQLELERLRQEFGSRSATSWSEEVRLKNEQIKLLKDEKVAAGGRLEKLQQTLEAHSHSAKDAAQKLQQSHSRIERLDQSNTTMQGKIKSLEQSLEASQILKEASDKAHQEALVLQSQTSGNQLNALEVRLNEVESRKCAVESKLSDLERQSSDEVKQLQHELTTLQQGLGDAKIRLKEMDERYTKHEEVIKQKDPEIDKLKQDLANAHTAAIQIPNSQPHEDSENPPTKKSRRVVNRNASSVSKPTSSAISAGDAQTTNGVTQSIQTRGTGSSMFGPSSKSRGDSLDEHGPEGVTHEDEDMLDLDNAVLRFAKTNSRPTTSQSETQNALSLGSKEILDDEGVRLRSQASRTQTVAQLQHQKQILSSSLSSPISPSDAWRETAQIDAGETQSQDQSGIFQQESYGLGIQNQHESLDFSGETQQQSMDLGTFVDLVVKPHSAFETPLKAGGKNLQGVGRKLTLRPESQTRSQSRPGALPSITTPRLLKASAVLAQQKKVSALSSGPHNFKTGGITKGKRTSVDEAEEEEEEEEAGVYSAPSSSVRGSVSPQKRSASQSTRNNKRQRKDTTTVSLPSTRQRSAITAPRRSQTTVKSSSQNRGPSASQGAATPAPQRRRSVRNNREQSMMSRFNDEMMR